MSKYIRFRNIYNDNNEEILNVSSWERHTDIDEFGCECFMYDTEKYTIFDNEIIKEADTIEKLCDEFVCMDSQNKEYRPLRFYFLNDLYKFIKENKLFEKYKVYGAIRTDKGLIYVAKMNDKGELELL